MAMQIEQNEAHTHVLVRESTYPGSWGRGKTVAEALRQCRINGGNGSKTGAVVYVCACDAEAYVDNFMGDLHTTDRGPIYKARVTARGLTLLEEYRPARRAADEPRD